MAEIDRAGAETAKENSQKTQAVTQAWKPVPARPQIVPPTSNNNKRDKAKGVQVTTMEGVRKVRAREYEPTAMEEEVADPIETTQTPPQTAPLAADPISVFAKDYMMSGADKTTNTDTVIRTLEESDHAQKLMTSKASRPAPAKKGKIIPAVPVVVSQGGARSSGNGKPTATSQTPATSSNAINIARAPTGIPTKTQAKEPRVDVPSTPVNRFEMAQTVPAAV